MQRILIVYYSRTGHVRSVAQAIAGACSADLEEIREARPRRGLLGWIRSIRDVQGRKCPAIQPPVHDVSAYDLVVLGCPVWASRVASPMRSFLTSHAAHLPEVALFCTMGGTGGDKVLREMAELSGKQPVATMVLRDSELKRHLAEKVEAYVGAFARAPGPEPAVSLSACS